MLNPTVAALLLAVPSAAPAQGFEMGEVLTQGVTLTLEGDPRAANAVWRGLRRRDPTHPASPVFETYTLYSRQVSDQNETRYDAEIAQTAEEAIALATARVEADDSDAEAHFYLGQAFFHRARLAGIRGSMLRAGADGERARKHLERALALQPSLVDAKLPLGMYYYYAGTLPQFVKWLRWLWFVPVGEKETGLRFLHEVHARGDLYRWDAAFFLMNIYTFHEPDYPRALEIGDRLRQRFPNNLLLANEYVDLLLEACRFEDAVSLAEQVERIELRNPHDAGLRSMARVQRARAQMFLGRPRLAWLLLDDFGSEGPERPYWGSAWVLLTRAQALDAQQRRSPAISHYERVTDLRAPKGSARARALAVAGLESPFEPEAVKCAGTSYH